MHYKRSLKFLNILIWSPLIVIGLRILFSIVMYVLSVTGTVGLVDIMKSIGNYILGITLFVSIGLCVAGVFLKSFRKEYNARLGSSDVLESENNSNQPQEGHSYTSVFKLGFRALTGGIHNRISRGEYLQGNIILYILPLILSGVGMLIRVNENGSSALVSVAMGLSFIAGLIMFIGGIILYIKRFRDLDEHRTHIFFLLIPFYNIYILAMLALKIGTIGSNKYGDDPLLHQTKSSKRYRIHYISIWVPIICVYSTVFGGISLTVNGERVGPSGTSQLVDEVGTPIDSVDEGSEEQEVDEDKQEGIKEQNEEVLDGKTITLSSVEEKKIESVYKKYCELQEKNLGLINTTSMGKDEKVNYIRNLNKENNFEGASAMIQNLIEKGEIAEGSFETYYKEIAEETASNALAYGAYTLEETLDSLLDDKHTSRQHTILLGNLGVSLLRSGDFDKSFDFYVCSATYHGDIFSMYRLAKIYKYGSDSIKESMPNLKVKNKVDIDHNKSYFRVLSVLKFDSIQKMLEPLSSAQWNSIGIIDTYTNDPKYTGLVDSESVSKSVATSFEIRYGAPLELDIDSKKNDVTESTNNMNSQVLKAEAEAEAEEEIIELAKDKALRFIELYNDDASVSEIADVMKLRSKENRSLTKTWIPSMQEKKLTDITQSKIVGYTKKYIGSSTFYKLYIETNGYADSSVITGFSLSIIQNKTGISLSGLSRLLKSDFEKIKDGSLENFVEI